MEKTSLRDASILTTLPALDLERAKLYYRDKLGLVPEAETESAVFYRARDGQFALFLSSGKSSGDHTQLGWTVADIEQTVAGLSGRGVVFEQYDDPDFKTVNGIATFGPNRFAWFRDSEGNMHSLTEFS